MTTVATTASASQKTFREPRVSCAHSWLFFLSDVMRRSVQPRARGCKSRRINARNVRIKVMNTTKDGHDEDLLRALAGFPESLLRFLASEDEIADSGRSGFLARDDVPASATQETVKRGAAYVLEKCYHMALKPRYTGLRQDRLRHPVNDAERHIAKAWQEFNKGQRTREGDVVDYITRGGSDRDRVIVNSTIQWLGTNVGQAFLRDILPHLPRIKD